MIEVPQVPTAGLNQIVFLVLVVHISTCMTPPVLMPWPQLEMNQINRKVVFYFYPYLDMITLSLHFVLCVLSKNMDYPEQLLIENQGITNLSLQRNVES